VEIVEKYSAIFPVRDDLASLLVSLPFLVSQSKLLGEIIVVVDDEADPSRRIKSLDLENLSILVNRKYGVYDAIATAVESSKFPFVIIGAADDFLPLLKFDEICLSLAQGKDFTSATRYSKKGKRYGGSTIGKVFSIVANALLRIAYPNTFSDFTTGFKGFRKDNWTVLAMQANGSGWSCALKFSLNAIKNQLQIYEVPVISVDRIVGGSSTFRPWLWIKSYLRMLII
jgi:hypothetical protein